MSAEPTEGGVEKVPTEEADEVLPFPHSNIHNLISQLASLR